VRATIADAYARKIAACPVRAALGRTGTRLLAGEDDEFSWVAHELGQAHGIFTELRLRHLIDKRRTQLAYFQSVMRGSGYSSALLAHLHNRNVRNHYAIPSLASALALARRLHPIAALLEIHRYIRFRRRPALDRLLAQALADGWEEGWTDIQARANQSAPERLPS
jgi:hypothetical protein